MDLGIKEKVYLVSGGSEGIGAAISTLLLKEGAKLCIATRATSVITEEFVELVDPDRSSVLISYGDLQDTENCQQAVLKTIEKFGKIDGIVNNAGVNDKVGLEAGPQAFRESIKLNLFHTYDLVHYALPYLKTSNATIVNIASKVAVTGQGMTSGYAAAKGGVLALTREWAVDLAGYGIRVNAILPAEVMTPMYRKWLESCDDPSDTEKKILNKIPFENRMTTAEEIASMVAFLLSNKSGHTTGQWMHVDGGYVHLDRMIT